MEAWLMNKTEKKIMQLFHTACGDYHLLEDGDRVLVALSGGKDSLQLVRLLGRQQKIYKPRIEVEAVHVVMDNIPYASDHGYLTDFCSECGVELHVVHTEFEERAGETKPKCFLCSWHRRKAIFTFATEHGFNKVALGHHQDDVLVTLLMNMFYQGSIQTMPPLLKMRHYPLSVIRPMCLVPERMVSEVAEAEGFRKQLKMCPYEEVTQRKEIETLFHGMEQRNPEVRHSLWGSMKNIYPEMLP